MMIKDLFDYTPTRPSSTINSLERYFNRRTIDTALQEQKHRRGVMEDCCHSADNKSVHSVETLTTCGNTISASASTNTTINQDQYIKELEQQRMDRLNKEQQKYFPSHDINNDQEEEKNNKFYGIKRKLNFEGVLAPIEMSSTVSSLSTTTTTVPLIRDVSNVRLDNRPESDPSLEDLSLSSYVHHIDENGEEVYYDQEIMDLEILASKAFDDDEEGEDHILDLEIDTAMAFDEDDDGEEDGLLWPMDEEEGFLSSSLSPSHDQLISQLRYFTMSSQIY